MEKTFRTGLVYSVGMIRSRESSPAFLNCRYLIFGVLQKIMTNVSFIPHFMSIVGPTHDNVLKPRPYQEELARDALYKHNVMVVAPTNSGKTHVAMYIAKVAFFVF